MPATHRHTLTADDVAAVRSKQRPGETFAHFTHRSGVSRATLYRLKLGANVNFRTITRINQRLGLKIKLP